MNFQVIGTFFFNNIEYVVAIIGSVLVFLYIKNKGRFAARRCNLNRFIIKYKKQTELLNKQTKTSTTLFGK
jgi:hypothetical protein